ncbi:MAG TPA: anti-sigma factor [Propionibacteriaceae bacterium]
MHTNPEVLALIALGENAGSSADHDHVHSCRVCSEEVADLARIADVGRSSTETGSLSAPRPEVWARISAELGFSAPHDVLIGRRPEPGAGQHALRNGDRAGVTGAGHANHAEHQRTAGSSVVPLTPTGAADRSGRGGGRRLLSLALAAAIALVVGIGVGVAYERQEVRPVNRVIASADLAARPGYPGASGTAEVTADGRGNRALVVRMSSPVPATGTVQVWLMDNKGTPTLMGTMTNGVATLPIEPGMSLFTRPTVDLSDEPRDDPDPGHSGRSILRGDLV